MEEEIRVIEGEGDITAQSYKLRAFELKDVSELDTPKLTPRQDRATPEELPHQDKATPDEQPEAGKLKASVDRSVTTEKTNMLASGRTADDITNDDVYNTNDFDSEIGRAHV